MKTRIKKWSTDWKIEECIDSEKGRLPNRYYFRERLCGRVKLTGNLATRLAGYRLIEKDLRNITEWLNQIILLIKESAPNEYMQEEYFASSDRKNFQTIKGLFVASVTFYGKLFTKAEGRLVKLERSWYPSEDLRSEHDDIMFFRNTFAAHSGDESPESVDVVLAIDPVRRRMTPPELFCELTQPTTIQYKDISTLKEMIKILHDRANKQISELIKLILEKDVYEKGMDYWY